MEPLGEAQHGAAAAAATPALVSAPAAAPEPTAPRPAAALALLEVLDRDGQVRQTWKIERWPLSIGRALDNDIVLADPHVAAHHLRLDAAPGGALLEAGATRNGVVVGARRIGAGGQCTLGPSAELSIGRTRLRLRLAAAALAAELALADVEIARPRIVPTLSGAVLLLGGVLLGTWLVTDPDRFARAAGSVLLTTLTLAALWCGVWALLSKTFTRQANFGWHLRVVVVAGLALLAMTGLPDLLAYAFSWSWVSDYAFVASYAIGAGALYCHMLAVEPARARVLRIVAVAGAAAGIALTLWLNQQRSGHAGDELYMSHLLPPALRLAPARPVDRFIGGLAALQTRLDAQARAPGRDDDDARDDDEPAEPSRAHRVP